MKNWMASVRPAAEVRAADRGSAADSLAWRSLGTARIAKNERIERVQLNGNEIEQTSS
jgi:hypothetical protein